MFALGLLSWMYSRPDRGDARASSRGSSPSKPDIAAANIAAFQAGWNFGETTEDFAVRYEVKPAAMPPGTYRNITGNPALALGLVAAVAAAEAAAVPRRLPDHPGLGHPARADQAQALRRTHHPGRGRDRRHRRGARRLVRRRARRHHHLAARASRSRARRSAWRSASSCRWSSSTSSAAARRPACRPRPSRPTCYRRCTAATARRRVADRRRAVAGGLLPRGDRGGPDRADLPHAGDPALRRLPGQRLRAVAAARGRRPARPVGRVRHRAERRGRAVPAVPARPARRWPGRGRSPARRASSTASAASRRPTRPATSRYDPANHDFMVRTRQAKVDGIARCLRRRGRRPGRRRAGAGARLGLDVRPDRRRVPGGARSAALPIAQAHLRHLNPFPADLGEVLRRYDKVVIPEMNLGQLAHADPGEVPGRRDQRSTRSAACRSRPTSWQNMLEDVVKNG